MQTHDMNALAELVNEKAKTHHDYLVDTRSMKVMPDDGGFRLEMIGPELTKATPISHHARQQITSYAGVPETFVKTLARHGLQDLLAHNINTLFAAKGDLRMVRTDDDGTRAFLSDRYGRIDHQEIMRTLLPLLPPTLQVWNGALTDSRLYLKFVVPTRHEVRVGEIVRIGLMISNSEIGLGRVWIAPFIDTLACTNGMVATKERGSDFSRRHFGTRKVEVGHLSRETITLQDKAVLSEAKDTINAILSQEMRDKVIGHLWKAADSKALARPIPAIQELGKAFSLTEAEVEKATENYLADGSHSRWGMANAVTKLAHDTDSYDRGTELQVIGGRISDLPESEWNRYAEAA